MAPAPFSETFDDPRGCPLREVVKNDFVTVVAGADGPAESQVAAAFFLLVQKGGPVSSVPAILAVGAAIMAIADMFFS